MRSYPVYILLCLCAFCSSLKGQENGKSHPADSLLSVVRCNDFEVTGDGSNAEWNNTQWVSLTPRIKGAYPTRVKIMYSRKGLYCLYHCTDSKITATLKGENLDLYREDVVEAFFWADERIPVYFEYELSPLNYELVLMVPNYEGSFLGWIPWHYNGDRLTRHAAAIQYEAGSQDAVQSWIGEFFIPFELLKPMVQSPPEKGTRWRANFYRIDYDKGQLGWTWVPVKKTFHDYERFGTIVFK
jgi:hypothetical protein